MFPELDAFGTGVIHVLAMALANILSLEFEADRLRSLRTQVHVVLEIFQGEIAAHILGDFDEFLSNSSSIETSLPLFGHCSERLRQSRILHELAWSRCSTAIPSFGILLQHLSSIRRLPPYHVLGLLPLETVSVSLSPLCLIKSSHNTPSIRSQGSLALPIQSQELESPPCSLSHCQIFLPYPPILLPLQEL